MTIFWWKLILHLRYHCESFFGKGSKGLFLLEKVFYEGKRKKTLHDTYDKKWKEKPGTHEMQNGL